MVKTHYSRKANLPIRNKTLKKSTLKSYNIYDNGGIPFIVKIKSPTLIDVYSNVNTETPYKLFTIRYNKLFIGDNLLQDSHSAKKGKYAGNSILVETGKNQYLYIGSEIYSFTTKDKILKFYSPLGNSAVPYPYAVGEELTYFLLDKKTIPNDLLNLKMDGYAQFYGHLVPDKTTAKTIQSSKKNFKVKKINSGFR